MSVRPLGARTRNKPIPAEHHLLQAASSPDVSPLQAEFVSAEGFPLSLSQIPSSV